MAPQLVQRVAQFGVPTGPEQLRDLFVGTSSVITDRPFEPSTLRREAYDSGASVSGVRFPRDVAGVLQVTDQIVDRLLGDLELVGEFGRTLPIQRRMTEHADVRGSDVV